MPKTMFFASSHLFLANHQIRASFGAGQRHPGRVHGSGCPAESFLITACSARLLPGAKKRALAPAGHDDWAVRDHSGGRRLELDDRNMMVLLQLILLVSKKILARPVYDGPVKCFN